MRNFIISPEGFIYILIGASLTVLTFWIWPDFIIIPLLITLFMAFFFRNPHREIIENEKYIYSPADGVVLNVQKLLNDDILGCEVYKVSIFLSIFSVHVNRTPVSGTVFYKKYIPGKFLPAFKSHASELNEKNIIGIHNETIRLVVIQITGFIARRIVDFVKVGDKIAQGSIFGLIKFGSCTEIVIPSDNVEIMVKKGEKVKGGITVIGVLDA